VLRNPRQIRKETLFLPSLVNRFAECGANFQVFKAMACHLWAQTCYGTWRADVKELINQFADPERALRVFHALERIRLDARLADDLPGMYRQMEELCGGIDELPVGRWQEALWRLCVPNATVEDSCCLVGGLYDSRLPAPVPYQGHLNPARVERVRKARLIRDRDLFRIGLLRMKDEVQRQPGVEKRVKFPDEAPGGESHDSMCANWRIVTRRMGLPLN